MRRNRPRTFLELSSRRSRSEILHDIIVTVAERVKRGRHFRLVGLSWGPYKMYITQALELGIIEEVMNQPGDVHYRKNPELAYVATEKGSVWARRFWEISKSLYGLEEVKV